MLKKLMLAIALMGLLAMVGCTQYEAPPPQVPEKPVFDNGAVIPSPPESNPAVDGQPPADRTWISPGKVMVSNFYPGARAEYPLTIHNGKDTVCSFSVSYRYPDHVGDGYVKPSIEAQDWVIIADPTPVLMPKETREVLVVLAMPDAAVSPATKWEFWVSVKDTTQTGMVQTELCARWLVSMRGS